MATLKVTRGEAAGVLGAQIDAGRTVVDHAEGVRDEQDYNDWTRKLTVWIDVTKEALSHVYVGDGEVESFEDRAVYRPGHVVAFGDWAESRDGRVGAVEDGISRLQSLRTTLAFAQEPVVEAAPSEALAPSSATEGPKEIFLVHGHDQRRDEVARFLGRASQNSYTVVILDEQPDAGLTLIEKLERYAGNAAYAVILFTGDDVGAEKAEVEKAEAAGELAELKPRARQNVVFEFGWFCGQIRRQHVAVLYETDVEPPSDITGLTYISLGREDWRERLVRNIRAAGLLEFSMDHV